MILTVTLNPSIDQTLFVDHLAVGDTNRVSRTEIDAGGKGVNLSRVAHSLSGKTLALGLAGGHNGDFLRESLDGEGVPHLFVKTNQTTRSNLNIETDDGLPPTTLNAKGPLISPMEWETFLSVFQDSVAAANWVCLCGSIPPGLDRTAYRQLIQIAKGKNLLIDADGEILHDAIGARPTLIKPNRKEAERLLGRPLGDPAHDVAVLREMTKGAYAIISLGSDGAVLACESGVYQGSAPQVESVSTIGSGDSMLGAFLARLEAGDPPAIAFQWGLAAGAATATTDGKQIGHASVIELLFDRARVEFVG